MHKNNRHIELIKKLVSGTINENERWELEKLSLDDPFVADAIEGYYSNEKQDENIRLLIKRIDQKRNKKSLVLKWLSVAASIIILLGLSFWTITQLGEDQSSLSENAALVSDDKINDGPTNQNDSENDLVSASSFDEELVETTVPPKKNITISKSAPRKKELNRNVNEKREEVVSTKEINTAEDFISMDVAVESENSSIPSKPIVPAPIEKMDVLESNSISGLVRTVDGIPIAEAEIVSTNSKIKAKTAADGRFVLDSVNENDQLIASASGFRDQSVLVEPDLDIRLQKSKKRMSEQPQYLAETIPFDELRRLYINQLDKYYENNRRNLCDGLFSKDNVFLTISLDTDNGLEKLSFSENVELNCQTLIENSIRDAIFQNIFTGNRAITFNYRLQLSQK